MPSFENGYALIIGVANYSLINNLPKSVEQDAQDIYALLSSPLHCGYLNNNTQLLVNQKATTEGVRKGIKWLSDTADTNDTALIFFSGHGGRIRSGTQTINHLIPFDYNPNDIEGTTISGQELTESLYKIKAERLVVFFDCCYAGGAGNIKGESQDLEFKSGLEEILYEKLAEGKGRVMIASSLSDEKSLVLPNMNNSLFTHYLLKALQGEASVQDDSLIRVFEVYDYVSKHFPESGPQHPLFKSRLQHNFPIALRLSGKNPSEDPIGLEMEITLTLKQINDLGKRLVNDFNNEEIEKLCLSLDILYQNLEGPIIEKKARELVAYCNRHGMILSFLDKVIEQRPRKKQWSETRKSLLERM